MPFIVFEGLDGSGKSTLIKDVEAQLRQRNISFVSTREPGGTPVSEDIRQLLLRPQAQPPTPTTEMLLYAAARAQHVETLVRPALKNNKWVLCDRFFYSTYAFQVAGRGLSSSQFETLNAMVVGDCKPDLWILVDVPVSVAQQRIDNSRSSRDRMEQENLDFHERVRQGYLKLAKEDAGKCLVLDGQKSPQQLFEIVTQKLKEMKWLS